MSNTFYFEQLENPLTPPEFALSPHKLIECGRGDTLDVGLMVCSILLGSGYDAYLVQGTAHMNLTIKNE